MPGERLMCVWQAVLSKDVFPESGVKRATVQSVVENFSGLPNITYTERRFTEVFTDQKVPFDTLVKYVDSDLRSPAASLLTILGPIEAKCWEMCETFFESEALNKEEICKMWYIFNRVCSVGTYPPTVSKVDADWLFEKIAKSMDKTWGGGKDALPDEGLTFQAMINMLDRMYFSVTTTSRVREGIDEIYNWLVKEIMKVGWLYKRTRKQSNWTNWLKRWFVMVPGRLTYYEQANMKVHKGEVILERNTTVEDMADYKGLLVKLENRFKITNKPYLEIELCAESQQERSNWLGLLRENLESVRTGQTPIIKLLQKRQASLDQEHSKELERSRENARKTMKPIRRQQNTEDKTKASNGGAPVIEKPLQDEEGFYDNQVTEIQRDKVRAIFMQIDTDGNGRIDKSEFFEFLRQLGTSMEQRESDAIFNGLDKDGNKYICFEEFYEAFLRMVMGDTNNKEEIKLRSAFLKADRDGSGAVSFREFAEFAYSSRRSIAMDQLIQSFDQLDKEGKGEIEFAAFKEFFDKEGFADTTEADQNLVTAEKNLEEYLKNKYDQTDASNLAQYLRKRWKTFASFKRYNADGTQLVMSGKSGMVADVVPGHYNLVDLALFNDLPPIKPRHLAVKGVVWQKSQISGKSGRILFPDDFSGKIPVDVATNEHLAYYGATLASGNQLQVSLLYRHGIQDFTYQNNYLDEYVTSERALGGAGIEKHEFAHLDCPLEDDSGTFIIAKFCPENPDELHLTGFKIPTRHTLYLPGGVIHSNDYLKGTWRTMLSDEVEIDHVQLTRVRNKGKGVEEYEKFIFTFE